jgi:hypothetical protein
MLISAGIDYSLTCPAICTYDPKAGDFCFENVKLYFRSNLTRFKTFKEGNLSGCNHGPWKNEISRYDDISNWAMDVLVGDFVDEVFLEGYAFGATGRVFNIAENTAILKYNIWDEHIECDVIAPKQIKKYATGSGNASKEDMYEAFCKEAPGVVDLRSILTPRSSGVISPLSDVVDSYFILKYGIYN